MSNGKLVSVSDRKSHRACFLAQVRIHPDGIVRALVRKGRRADRFGGHLDIFTVPNQLENTLAGRNGERERYGSRF